MKKIFLTLILTISCVAGLAFFASRCLLPKKDSHVTYFERVKTAADWLQAKTGSTTHPTLMIVLTGGVEGPEKLLTNRQEIVSSTIPHFPKARVQGHEGKLIFGKLDGTDIVILKGRFHYYEGNSPQEVVFPYFVLHQMGVRSLITTHAVGGIREDLGAGAIMLITDHINNFGENSLRGLAIQRPHDQFTDMTNAYNSGYQEIARKVAREQNIELKQGVYIAANGPCYETKAETRAYRQWGADVVGMSLVFEVIACNFLGIKVLAFAAVSNPSADRHSGAMNHNEVLAAMATMTPQLSLLVTSCAREIVMNPQKR